MSERNKGVWSKFVKSLPAFPDSVIFDRTVMHEVKIHLQNADDEDMIKGMRITLGDGGLNQLVSILWMLGKICPTGHLRVTRETCFQ